MKSGVEAIREARRAVAEANEEDVEFVISDGLVELAVAQEDGRVAFVGTEQELGRLLEFHRRQRRRGRAL